jgi:PHO85 cyclin-5
MGFVPFSHSTSIPPKNHPYASSISSSASSSSSSVFSTDGASSQASASSTNSLQIVWETDSVDAYSCADSYLSAHELVPNNGISRALRRGSGKDFRVANEIATDDCRSKPDPTPGTGGDIPPEQRKNPRRNNRSGLDCESTAACHHQKPSLPRPSARKVNFVDNLVDSAAQIVEVIWPLSVVACRSDSSLGGKGVLPLRTFIQETLRRSRTSYSTLQVALYYLVVLRPHVPKHDFTMEQPEDGQALRALQCGRRMFLAALILASKYLQDRNYSARAWSKISGLNTQEINLNEMTFLSAVNWRLHISETVFQRWTDIVLKYTPSAPPPSSPNSSPFRMEENMADWSSVIPILTPDLDTVEVDDANPSSVNGIGLKSTPDTNMLSPKSMNNDHYGLGTPASDSTPTPMYNSTSPRVLEPLPIAFNSLLQPLPEVVRIESLPTPQLTPPTVGFNTPAVSVGSYCPGVRRSSIGAAMAHVQSVCTARTTMDRWSSSLPPMQNVNPALTVGSSPSCQPRQQQQQQQQHQHYSGYRRSSLARTCSSSSSPESMVSDSSSRSSRSSSISSVASLACAPNQAKLAIQATCRSAKLRGREDGLRTFIPMSSTEDISYLEAMDFTSSPEPYTSAPGPIPDFSNFSLSTPRQNPVPCRRRDAAKEAARSLRDGFIHRQRPSQLACSSPTNKGLKRCRVSDDFSALHQQVRNLITCSRDQKERADAPENPHLLPTVFSAEMEVKRAQSPTRLSPRRLPLQKEMGRKRACCGEEVTMGIRKTTGPGMWEGIL